MKASTLRGITLLVVSIGTLLMMVVSVPALALNEDGKPAVVAQRLPKVGVTNELEGSIESISVISSAFPLEDKGARDVNDAKKHAMGNSVAISAVQLNQYSTTKLARTGVELWLIPISAFLLAIGAGALTVRFFCKENSDSFRSCGKD